MVEDHAKAVEGQVVEVRNPTTRMAFASRERVEKEAGEREERKKRKIPVSL